MVQQIDENGKTIFITTLADTELPIYDSALTFDVKYEDGTSHKIAIWRFIEMYLKITDKDGNFIPFRLNKVQIKFYKSLCVQQLHNQPMRVNILKARQLGLSTIVAAIIFCLTAFRPNRKACIVADKEENARNLFDKYITFYEALPEWIKSNLPKQKSNARELRFDYGKGQFSLIRILVQGEDSGRSYSFQYIHASECAAWKDLKKTMVSLTQTVSKTNIDSLIALETTAKGFNDYKARWDKDLAGNTSYQALFYAWYEEPTYSRPYSNFQLYDWEKEMMEKFHLSLEQVAWYREQFNECDNDLSLVRQENPSNMYEAFMTSGNSVFNAELTAKRKGEVVEKLGDVKCGFFAFQHKHSLDGSSIEISDIKFVESRGGEVKIYEPVNDRHPYIVVNDPAMGGEDYYATQVFDNYTGHQVAVYHKNKCDADEVAYQMYCLGKYYNDAMITGETNTTAYLLEVCHKCGYRFIYQDQDIEDLSTHFYNKYGYKTKQNNRQQMIDCFKQAFRDNPEIINDYETLCEMEQFQVVRNESTGKEKIEASGSSHDDLVMACCGFYLCRHAQSSIPMENPQKKKGYAFDPYESYKERQKKLESEKGYQIWD